METGKIKIVPILTTLLIILSLVIVSFLFYKYSHSQQELESLSSGSTQLTEEQKQKLIVEISKLIELPVDEQPTVVTIADINKLKDQPFFAKAKNGDKVLIYSGNKKAYLYDPVAKKIIDVAPVSLGSDSAQPATSSATVSP